MNNRKINLFGLRETEKEKFCSWLKISAIYRFDNHDRTGKMIGVGDERESSLAHESDGRKWKEKDSLFLLSHDSLRDSCLYHHVRISHLSIRHERQGNDNDRCSIVVRSCSSRWLSHATIELTLRWMSLTNSCNCYWSKKMSLNCHRSFNTKMELSSTSNTTMSIVSCPLALFCSRCCWPCLNSSSGVYNEDQRQCDDGSFISLQMCSCLLWIFQRTRRRIHSR